MRLTTRRYAVRRWVLVTWLAVALGALLPAGAWAAGVPAHAELRSLTPANGATLAAPPTELVLVFNEDINPAFVQVSLTRAGAQVALAAATVTRGTVTVPVPPSPEVGAGAYRIAYRVVSADGHPVSGAGEFSVTAPAATASAPAATASPTTSASPTSVATPEGSATAVAASAAAGSSSGMPGPVLAALVAVVVVGVGGALWYRQRRLRPANRGQ